MHRGWIIVGVALAAMVGDFTYRLILRPVDPPTDEMRAVALHFNREGIAGHLYPVRHGYRHSQVLAAAAFQIDDFPLPVGLIACATDAEAAARSVKIPGVPVELQSVRNGRLVMDFMAWGDGSEEMAAKIAKAFASLPEAPVR